MDNFEEIKELVLHYVRGIWKNRWIAIIIAWPLMLAGIAAVDQIKDRYQAETKVYIDTSSVLRPLLKGLAVQTDFQSNVRLMVRKLLSRPNLERAIRQMDMDIDVNTPADMEKLIDKIRDRVKIKTKNRSGTYTISYQDENRARAKRMVQTLLDIFVEDTLGKSVKESDSAISFLDKQIAKYETLLQQAETRLEEFKRKNVGIMPKDGASYYTQLQQASAQLEQARLQLAEAQNRRDKLKTQMASLATNEGSIDITSSYDQRIADQESKLEDLLLRYTDEHPDVIHARKVLKALKQRKQKELERNQKTLKEGKLDNPVAQQLQILLTETEASISSLNARVASYAARKQQLRKMVDIIPQVEAELKRLNRDYNINKKNYDTLVSRREQAKISEDVQSGTEQVKFRVIEPPHVPLKASFPNRPLFDAGVLVLALGAGYGFGLLISLAQPVFYNASELKKYAEIPVLGSVMKFDTKEVLSQRRKNLMLFALANLLLIITAAVLIFLHSRGVLLLSSLEIMVLGR